MILEHSKELWINRDWKVIYWASPNPYVATYHYTCKEEIWYLGSGSLKTNKNCKGCNAPIPEKAITLVQLMSL